MFNDLPLTLDVRCPKCRKEFVVGYSPGDIVSAQMVRCPCGHDFPVTGNTIEKLEAL